MKKRSWKQILLRILLIIIGTPIAIAAFIITLLYVPSIQRSAVEKACKEIAARSGYDIEIGSISLSFPLKLKATDYRMSKDDSVYFKGKDFNANISLIPLFTGKVEINYVSLEELDVNTRDISSDFTVDGKVGFLRLVARDADIAEAVADIRQLYLADTDLNIVLSDTTADEESDPLEWIINLHKGRIKNSSIKFSMPGNTLSAGVYIGKMRLNKGSINIPETSFAVKNFALRNSNVEYDRGENTPDEAPLDHIRLENINISAHNMLYAGNDISANIRFSMEQPGGIAITDAAAHFTGDKDTLQLHTLEINSRNGSRIYGQSTIPQKALSTPGNGKLTAKLFAEIKKPDLARLITPQLYDNLHYFDEELLSAEVALSGNIQRMDIDTMTIGFPAVGAINATGRIEDVLKGTGAKGHIAFDSTVDDIKKFIGSSNDSIDGRASADGNLIYDNGKIDADIALHCTGGEIKATGHYNIADTTYSAQIKVDGLALAEIMPDIPLHNLTMELNAEGCGFDIFNNLTQYNVNANVDTLYYAGYRLHAIDAFAAQDNCTSLIEVEGHDKNLLFGIDATTKLAPTGIENRTTIELTNADFKEIGVVDSMLKTSTSIDIAATTDFKESHSLRIAGNDINIVTKQNRFTPESLSFDFSTTPKQTSIKVHNGDLNIDGEMDCGYKKLFAVIDEIATMNNNMISGKSSLYHLHDYEAILPRISLNLNCGEKNIMHNFLAFTGINTKEITVEADISHSKGLNIKGDVSKFSKGDIKLDSIRFATRQNGEKLDYIVGANDLTIASLNDNNNLNALLYGSIKCDTITTNLLLRDNIRKTDSKAGLTACLSPGNMNIRLHPEALIFGAPFSFNNDNYINIGKAMSVEADVTFTGDNNSGFHLYTTPDSRSKYDINLELFEIHLDELTNALPGLPEIGGNLFAKLNYKQRRKGFTFTCDANVDKLTYDGNSIGDERVEFSYSPKRDDLHDIKCKIFHNDAEIAYVKSDYRRGLFNGNISLTRLPLDITQAFIDKEGVLIDGYLNSKIEFNGTLDNMKSYGYLNFDSTYVYSPMLGAMLHFAEDMIMIENNNINLQKYHIYDKVNTPFVIDGTVDINNLLNPKLNLRLNASNYEILNTRQEPGKMVYGKIYVDLRSALRGTPDNIAMMGTLTLLNSSNFAYILPETGFTSSKDMDGLVEFVNFNDTTAIQQEQPKIDLGNIKANLNVIIQQGAKMSIDFDSSRDSYVSIVGDGNLNATYDNINGISVTGIYQFNSGEVKLRLPIIPLKTFYIQEGGRLTWAGDLFNPTIDITAMEKITAPVELEENNIQQVVFNAGVVVQNTINDLNVDFIITSPENSVIQNQLNELDRETLSRYAVAMIITGTYLGGNQGITAASALSSFLDAKINEISGTAIKDFDVNIGINDALNTETGNTYTNYSFSFSKRFFNDRITIVIGGEVNSGDRPDKTAGGNSFINNVSLEWKLNKSGNRNIRVFYDKNYQSLLEGEIIETGIGYVYKRKLNKLKELFIFRKKEKNTPAETTNNTRAKQ